MTDFHAGRTFASSCAENWASRGVADVASDAYRSGASKSAVAKLQATLASSWALKSSGRVSARSPIFLNSEAQAALRASSMSEPWTARRSRGFAYFRGCSNFAAPQAAFASARASQPSGLESSWFEAAKMSSARFRASCESTA